MKTREGSAKAKVKVSSRDPFANLVLPKSILTELRGVTKLLRDAEGFKQRWGAELPLGMILEGPPGTGKTEIARALAGAGGFAFMKVSGADVRASAAYGEAEQAVADIFAEARRTAPTLIFFDEMDALAGTRRDAPFDGTSSADNSVVAMLLQELQGFEQREDSVFTVGATNRYNAIDSAVRSRLSRRLYIGLPDLESRLAMLERFTASAASKGRLSADLTDLAVKSEGYSGRALRNLVADAILAAEGQGAGSLTNRHFESVLSLNPGDREYPVVGFA